MHVCPEHLLICFFTRCCAGCRAWSPKKDNSVSGTFVLNVSRWNDHGEVWALRGDKRSRLWYVLRVGLPSGCPTECHPLCSLTTSACLNVDSLTQTSIVDLKDVPRRMGRGLFCLFRYIGVKLRLGIWDYHQRRRPLNICSRTQNRHSIDCSTIQRLVPAFLTSSPRVPDIPRQALHPAGT